MVSWPDIQSRREEILRIADRYGARNVRVFGSVARRQEGPASDVDLLVHMDDDRSLLDQIALIRELEALLGCPVDVVSDEALHWTLREKVLAEGVCL